VTASQLDDHTTTLEADQGAMSPVEIYERFAAPALFAPAAARLLEVARPRPGERVLDVGTGTGIVARRTAPLVLPDGTVTGIDLSPDMLAVASSMANEEGLSVDWQEGRAEDLPFPEGSFDLVLCQFALMFFTDRGAALDEMRRVLVPGGRVAISVFQRIDLHPFYVALNHAITRQLGVSAVGDIFALGDVGVLRASLDRAGFREVTATPFELSLRVPDPDSFLAGELAIDAASIPAMQGLSDAARRELAAAIQDEMAEPLRAITDGDHVQLTFYAQIVRATR
jgi:SAM-dependent methyltransferase